MPILEQANIFHYDTLIANVLITDFYCNHVCVGLAKIFFLPLGRREYKKAEYTASFSLETADIIYSRHMNNH